MQKYTFFLKNRKILKILARVWLGDKKMRKPLRGLRQSVRFLADGYFFAFFSAGSSTMRPCKFSGRRSL